MSKNYKSTPSKQSYDDTYNGAEDLAIKKILFGSDDSNSDNIRKMKKVLSNVIKNELTEWQQKCIDLYFFEGMNIIEIGKTFGVSPQAVSAALIRAKRKIYKFLVYYTM